MITTVVGNYPKVPSLSGGPNLRTALTRFDQGRITKEELEQVIQQATKDAIAEQTKAGLDLVTDGHIRWEDEITYFTRGLSEVSLSGLLRFFDSNTYYRQPVVEGDLRWKEVITVNDLKFAVEVSQKPVKAVLPGPFTVAAHCRDDHYHDFKTLALAVAQALNKEAHALQDAGATFIQFNEPSLLKAKDQFSLFQQAAEVVTAGLSVKTALYTYFGDITGLYPELFLLPFQVFGLDFVIGEANFGLLKSFPAEKELGYGVVDARNTKLETIEELVGRLDQVRSAVPLERVYLNPNCGLEYLPRKNAYDKLVRMVAAAERAKEVLR